MSRSGVMFISVKSLFGIGVKAKEDNSLSIPRRLFPRKKSDDVCDFLTQKQELFYYITIHFERFCCR